MQNIGFIGLGAMGLPMAQNLAKAGYKVTGFDLNPAAMEAATAAGLACAASAADAVTLAQTIITMLPSGPAVLAAYGGLLPAAARASLFLDCSTIDIGNARAAHAAASAAGMAALDAPVSGGVAGAAAASLTFMVGGTAQDLGRAQPLLAAMGKRIVHCGEAGAGQAAKICNNMILGISMIAVSEAFNLADKLGLDRQALFDVASTSSGQCWALTSYCPVPGPVPASPANHGYKPGFSAQLMLKDLGLSQQAAAAAGVNTPLGARAAALYQAFVASGGGAKDFSGIITALQTGLEAAKPS